MYHKRDRKLACYAWFERIATLAVAVRIMVDIVLFLGSK